MHFIYKLSNFINYVPVACLVYCIVIQYYGYWMIYFIWPILYYFMYILLNFSLKIEYLKINILSLHLLDNLDMFIFSKM